MVFTAATCFEVRGVQSRLTARKGGKNMWVFTTSSFLSVVVYDEGRDGYALPLPDGASPNDLLLVRARVFSDLTATLDALGLAGSRAVSTPGADYPSRVVLSREEWTRYLSLETLRIEYRNFKNEVLKIQGRERHDLYMKLWVTLRGLERAGEAEGDSARW
jgi:hypothetical protein